MPARNTDLSFGAVSRSFHWLTALLILTTFPLGMIADALPWGTAEELALKAQVFSLHKTLGTLVFFVALARILWTLGETRPAPLHPERRLEHFAAEAVHWLLYVSLVVVPLSGWIHHAAVEGFAPILWPFGQGLPFIPKSEGVANLSLAAHWLFTKLLLLALVLHVAGALKHVLIDRDATLSRMVTGKAAGPGRHGKRSRAPMAVALTLWALAILGAVLIARPATDAAQAEAPSEVQPAGGGSWQVESGSLDFTIRQMGSEVAGHFPTWTAMIDFDETPRADGTNGSVEVGIDIAGLTLGSVTEQARDAEYFDTANHPEALFQAVIRPEGSGHVAEGTLRLKGVEVPVNMPFTLSITDGLAQMQGEVTLDRRDYGIGASQGDESMIGFAVVVKVELTARRPDQRP